MASAQIPLRTKLFTDSSVCGRLQSLCACKFLRFNSFGAVGRLISKARVPSKENYSRTPLKD